MTTNRAEVLLIDPAGSDSSVAVKLRDVLGEAGISVHVVDDAGGAVKRLSQTDGGSAGHGGAAVVLVAPEFAGAIVAARQVYRADPLVPVVFLEAGERAAQRQREITLAPVPGAHWSLADPGDPLLPRLVADAAASTRQRRQFRTTLDRMNLRLSSRPPADALEYRKLIASDRYLVTLLKHIPDATLSLDAMGTITSWNLAAERLFRVPATQAIGQAIMDVAAWPQDFGGLMETARGREAALTRELTCGIEDQVVDVEVTLSAVRDAQRLLGLVMIVRDISGRKRAEERLRESEELVRTIAENSTQGLAMMDERGYCTYVNKAWLEMTGYTDEEIRSKPLHDLVHHHYPDGRPFPKDECPIDRALPENFDVRAHEDLFFRKDGSTFPVLCAASPVFKNGRPVSTVIEIRDMTEAHRVEAARRQSEVRLRLTADAIPAIVAYVDAEQRYQFANSSYRDWFGFAPEQVLGASIREVLGEAVYAQRLEFVKRALSGEVVRFEQELPHVVKGRRDTETTYVPDIAEDGTVRGFVLLVYDITERREAERERERLLQSEQAARADAERASRMKDEFLATLSHELRTPLNAILGWAQILSTGSDHSPEDIREGLGTIQRNARVQTQIIEDLLDMSRIISGKVRLDVQRTDVAPVVRAAVETVTPAADAKSIRLQVVLDPHAGLVSGDPNRLQQVFWNLLSNAIKFTPKGGRIQVLLERVNSHLEVSVIDTGEGIAPEFLPHVFDRFRQADASTTRRHGGLGLGLALAKQLIELHGGSIRAKSLGLGHGATFTVSLPLTVVHPEPEPEMERRHPRSGPVSATADDMCPRLGGVKVLVVDDEPDARALVKRLLEDCDAAVTTASSVQEALECLRADRPDVLISDIGMPGEDGYALIRRVRALAAERGGNLPAIALTAYARSEDRTRSILAGYQMHVAKPVEPSELIATVASLAGRAG